MAVARRASSQLLSSRSIHLRIQPRPANLSESREIFRVMQRFGELSMYKSLRYEYHSPADNIALAIYRDADAAQRALNASPIRFSLEKLVPDDNANKDGLELSSEWVDDASLTPNNPLKDGVEEILRPSSLLDSVQNSNTQNPRDIQRNGSTDVDEGEPVTRGRATPMPFEDTRPPLETSTKWFQVTIDRSRVVHQDFVERQPYWKQFSPMKSLAQEELVKVVPHVGLSDVSKRPPGHHRTPVKVLKTMSHYVDNHMPSLAQMYEEGGRERKPDR